MANIKQILVENQSGDTELHDIVPESVGKYAADNSVKTASCPTLAEDETLEVQTNKLASASTATMTSTSIYLNRTSNVKYPTAKAVWEYIQSLL